MAYFKYNPVAVKNLATKIIGSTKKEVIECINCINIDYLNQKQFKEIIDIPNLDKIENINNVEINCYPPMSASTHVINAKILDNFVFNINAGIYYYMADQFKNLEKTKKGPLYFLQTTHINGALIPRIAVEAVKKYDWNQHKNEVKRMLEQREKVLQKMKKRKILVRIINPKLN